MVKPMENSFLLDEDYFEIADYEIEYDLTYYNITNMLIYKYNGIKIGRR